MTWELVWKLALTIAVFAEAVRGLLQAKVNSEQSRFNREVLAMFARLRENRALRDALERPDQVARDAGRGLRGV